MSFDHGFLSSDHTKAMHHHHHHQTLALNEPASEASASDKNMERWERDKCKALIIGHPMYEQLLEAHVSCLRVATPVDQISKIDAQLELATSQQLFDKYSAYANSASASVTEQELDHFMVITP